MENIKKIVLTLATLMILTSIGGILTGKVQITGEKLNQQEATAAESKCGCFLVHRTEKPFWEML